MFEIILPYALVKQGRRLCLPRCESCQLCLDDTVFTEGGNIRSGAPTQTTSHVKSRPCCWSRKVAQTMLDHAPLLVELPKQGGACLQLFDVVVDRCYTLHLVRVVICGRTCRDLHHKHVSCILSSTTPICCHFMGLGCGSRRERRRS